jgi:flagellar basal body rod protein FlgF
MTDDAALTPELAVGYLRELSADIRAAAVLTAAGEPLAGEAELTDAARRLLAAAPGAAEIEVASAGGVVHAARSDRHAVVAVCGRFALPSLVRYDLKVVLGELAGSRSEAA